MEAKTALELWNDGVEGRLNLQLYRCDVDSLLQASERRDISPLRFSGLDSLGRERLFGVNLDEDFILEGQVTPPSPLRLFDHLDPPTYEELFEQNWKLFASGDSDQELESSSKYVHKNVPKNLDLLDSRKVPEPTCLTRVIETMVMYPSPIKKVPKKRKRKKWGRQKKSRPPGKPEIMVSDDENNDDVEPEVEAPPEGIVACEGFQKFYQSEQPTSPRVLSAPSGVVPPFAEHLARCEVDWDYPRALFAMGGYEPEFYSQKMMPSQTGGTSGGLGPDPSLPSTSFALEERSTFVLNVSNEFSRRKRYASSSLSNRLSTGPDENVEATIKPTGHKNKRRRLVT